MEWPALPFLSEPKVANDSIDQEPRPDLRYPVTDLPSVPQAGQPETNGMNLPMPGNYEYSTQYDAATNTISQDMNAAHYSELNILRNTDWTASTNAAWITLTPRLSHNATYYQFLSINDQLRLQVAKNETGVEREAVITLTSTLDNNLSSTFKVKQAGN